MVCLNLYNFFIESCVVEFGQTLKTIAKTPVQKYPHPKTSSQHIGWHHERLVPLHTSNSNYSKKSCEETAYADILVRSSTGNKKNDGKAAAPAQK